MAQGQCVGQGGGLDLIGFITNPVGAIIDLIAQLLLSAALGIYHTLVDGIPGLDIGAAKDVNGEVSWLVVYLAVGSLIYAAAKMAYDRRGNAGEAALKGMLRLIFVAAAGTTVISAAAFLAEDYSNHLFQQAVRKLLLGIGCTSGNAVTGILLLVLAFLLLISAIVQVILLYIRFGVMVVLLGTLPVAASASMTDWGVSWWRKHIGWMVAWILYKPTAALVMYAGATLIGNSESDMNKKLGGIGLMLLAAVALPALLKIIVPAVGALGSGGGDHRGVSPGMGMAASGAKKIGGAAGTAAVGLAQKGTRGATGASDKGPSGGVGQNGKSAPVPAAARGGGGQGGGGGGQSGGGDGVLPTGAVKRTGSGGSGGGGIAPGGAGGGRGVVPGPPPVVAAQAVGQALGNTVGRVAQGANKTIAGAVNNPQYENDGPSGANH